MRAFGMRVPVVLGVMAVVLALLLGGQLLHERRAVEQPLLRQIRHQPAVQAVNVSDAGDTMLIDVKLGPVQNLRETYRALQQQAASVLGNQHFTLAIDDARTPQLVDDYYKLNAILMEGLATGHFVEMRQRTEAEGNALGLDRAEVVLDQRQMYVTLVKGKQYLYALVPRHAAALPDGGGAS